MESAPFLLGIVYGLGVCSWNCLPYIGSYIMGEQKGSLSGFKIVIIFNLGKLASYALLGAIAGYIGKTLTRNAGGNTAAIIAAITIIWLGGNLLFKSKCACEKDAVAKADNYYKVGLLGFTVGLIPCLPLSGVLLYAAAGNSALRGCINTTLFGIGTMLSPLLLLGGAMGWFSNKLASKVPQYRTMAQKVCGLLLISTGVNLLLRFI